MALQPEVRDLTMPEAGTAHNVAVVSIDRRYEGQAVKVAQSLWGAGQMMFNKYLLVVPSGTDVRDSDALARCCGGSTPCATSFAARESSMCWTMLRRRRLRR